MAEIEWPKMFYIANSCLFKYDEADKAREHAKNYEYLVPVVKLDDYDRVTGNMNLQITKLNERIAYLQRPKNE